MSSNQTKLELTCQNGHKSEHLLDRVLRRNDAWCPKCGAGIHYDPAEEPAELEAA